MVYPNTTISSSSYIDRRNFYILEVTCEALLFEEDLGSLRMALVQVPSFSDPPNEREIISILWNRSRDGVVTTSAVHSEFENRTQYSTYGNLDEPVFGVHFWVSNLRLVRDDGDYSCNMSKGEDSFSSLSHDFYIIGMISVSI